MFFIIHKTIKQPNSLNMLGLKRSLKLNLDVLVPRASSLYIILVLRKCAHGHQQKKEKSLATYKN